MCPGTLSQVRATEIESRGSYAERRNLLVEGSNPSGPTNGRTGELVNLALWMQRQGYRETSILGTITSLKSIARHVNLENQESCKEYVAKHRVSENRKLVLVDALARYYKCRNISFQIPPYKKTIKLPFIPLEREGDDLISGCNKKQQHSCRY